MRAPTTAKAKAISASVRRQFAGRVRVKGMGPLCGIGARTSVTPKAIA